MKWIQRKAKNSYNSEDTIVEKLSKIRGINDPSSWMNPSSRFAHDPYKLDNIDEAVQSILRHVAKGSKIVIAGDCRI